MKVVLKIILVLVVFLSSFSNVKEINRALNANYFAPFQYARDHALVIKLFLILCLFVISYCYYDKHKPDVKILYLFKTLFLFKVLVFLKYIYQVNSFFGLF